MKEQPQELTIKNSYEVLQKVVKRSGNSGTVYLPKTWENLPVMVVRLAPLPENEYEYITNFLKQNPEIFEALQSTSLKDIKKIINLTASKDVPHNLEEK